MRSKRGIRNALCGGVAGILAAALAAGPVTAAEDAAEEEIEEIKVTATRRETNVMETPFAIQAFGGEELEKQNILDTRDLYDYIPGLLVQEENSRNDHTVQMRGSSISSVSADDGQSAVGYYLDDVPWVGVSSQVSPNIDYFDVQRVEVLRGPQGTSFGQDATGGSIRVYTNDPDLEDFGFKVKGSFGDRSGVSGNADSVSGVVNIPVVVDTFGLRMTYNRSYDPGHGSVQDRPDIGNPTEVTANNYRIKALWRITDTLDATFSHSKWDWETPFFVSPTTLSNDGGKTVMRPLTGRLTTARFPDGVPDNSATNEWTTLTVKWDLGWAEFTSSTGHAESSAAFNKEGQLAGPLSSGIGFPEEWVICADGWIQNC